MVMMTEMDELDELDEMALVDEIEEAADEQEPEEPALSLTLAMGDDGPVRLPLNVVNEEYSGQFYIEVKAPKSDGAITDRWQRMGGAVQGKGGRQFVPQANLNADQLFRLRWWTQTTGFCLPMGPTNEPVSYDPSKDGRNKANEAVLDKLMLPKSKGLHTLWTAFMDYVAARDGRDEQFDKQFKALGNA
jgi:hypothetical protein